MTKYSRSSISGPAMSCRGYIHRYGLVVFPFNIMRAGSGNNFRGFSIRFILVVPSSSITVPCTTLGFPAGLLAFMPSHFVLIPFSNYEVVVS